MKLLVSNTNHYSWPKACAITGIGSSNMIGVKIDNDAAMDLCHLEEVLEEHLKNEQGTIAWRQLYARQKRGLSTT